MNVMMIKPIIEKIPTMIIAMTLMISCSKKDNLIVPSESVADFHLGQKLTNGNYDKNYLEIKLSDDNLINEIIVLSDQYETAKGAKVGLTFAEVKEKQGQPLSEHLSIKKGSNPPFKEDTNEPAEVLIYNGIIFFPEKNTNTVKSILVTNEPWY